MGTCSFSFPGYVKLLSEMIAPVYVVTSSVCDALDMLILTDLVKSRFYNHFLCMPTPWLLSDMSILSFLVLAPLELFSGDSYLPISMHSLSFSASQIRPKLSGLKQ